MSYEQKYLKTVQEVLYTLTEKNLIKSTIELAFFQKIYCCRWYLVDCFICQRFRFIYQQYMLYIDNEKNKMLWKIYLKTNKYAFDLKFII